MTELVFDDAEAPRQGADPSPMGRLSGLIRQLRADVDVLQRGTSLRNASISGGQGLRILDDDGTLQAQIAPDRTITVFDPDGAPIVRMGEMLESGPQDYGIEVRIGGSWIQLGSQNVAWDNVGAKPVWAQDGGSVPAAYISGTVAAANSANWAALADGSQHAFNNTVQGTQFYAVWVGNDGGFHLGRNTSSRKYKQNIRDHPTNDGVLGIQLADFDRLDQLRPPAEGIGPSNLIRGSRDEFGAIAEQVAEVFPEAVQWFEGEIDGIRYEMIGLGLVPVVREHETRLAAIETEQRKQAARLAIIEQRLGL